LVGGVKTEKKIKNFFTVLKTMKKSKIQLRKLLFLAVSLLLFTVFSVKSRLKKE
jgi:hypothetical protein